MPLKLMYITNQAEVAMIAEKSGVNWIFVDLEINGKDERQGHLDTVISRHSIHDVKRIKNVLTKSKLLVRVNPIYEESKNEINMVIADGADIVMLPFFKTKDEVETFVRYIDGRAKVCLLCETSEAVENMDSILTVSGIDYIHIGLNDLHLSYNMKFMFELLVDGTVEMLCNKIQAQGIPYGFGGIARIGQGSLPAENIIAEHYRLGSSMAILSRSFCNTSKEMNLDQIEAVFDYGLNDIREYEKGLLTKDLAFFKANQEFVKGKVTEIVYTSSK
ncbi:HpcH/HpaI aldolase/citrate lyase family protein [Neobacillus niacini]|uniref:HpcH/HpaI aldolase/citrate lyase family protein n=1 Tax=Neobacillus niacini TaxID=86668 RepID=UPI0021CB2BE7|nr:HpcH/HpaI aldolase/citrate lyase family protein [Neobacillus niacini]MCM3763939.1 HpcH/HpaI aldolase/citrate lyase family protein [Neobacillus niacini]